MQALAVDTKTAAAMIGLSPKTVGRYVRAGRIRVVRVGRRITIPIHSLERFLEVDQHPGQPLLQRGKNPNAN